MCERIANNCTWLEQGEPEDKIGKTEPEVKRVNYQAKECRAGLGMFWKVSDPVTLDDLFK